MRTQVVAIKDGSVWQRKTYGTAAVIHGSFIKDVGVNINGSVRTYTYGGILAIHRWWKSVFNRNGKTALLGISSYVGHQKGFSAFSNREGGSATQTGKKTNAFTSAGGGWKVIGYNGFANAGIGVFHNRVGADDG